MTELTEIKRCRICGSDNLQTLIDLGEQPPANAFLMKKDIPKERKYPLKVMYCKHCGLFQLSHIVSPNILFKDYAYFAGQSGPVNAHFQELVEKIKENITINKDDLTIDIGSNDGTLLKQFDCKTLGVDPAENVAKIAQSRGVDTIIDFFSTNLAFEIMEHYGKAKVITLTNTFAHIPNLWDLLAGVRTLLADDGLLAIEVPYFGEMFENAEFDTIYHEHSSYFLVRPIKYIFDSLGLKICYLEFAPFHGGSMRIFASPILPEAKTVHNIVEFEKDYYTDEKLSLFTFKALRIREAFRALLKKLRKENKTISGYGAPAKATVLLNYCKIQKAIQYISDTTTYKQGRVLPGMHIPIVSPEQFHECPTDYTIIFPWNYKDVIMKKEAKFISEGGKFIVPIPAPMVVGE